MIAGKPVLGWLPPVAVGHFLYLFTRERTAIDLAGGRVVGRARPDARLAQPSYVPIP
jgi:hypothetical protein